jgi:hypothetical protein
VQRNGTVIAAGLRLSQNDEAILIVDFLPHLELEMARELQQPVSRFGTQARPAGGRFKSSDGDRVYVEPTRRKPVLW